MARPLAFGIWLDRDDIPPSRGSAIALIIEGGVIIAENARSNEFTQCPSIALSNCKSLTNQKCNWRKRDRDPKRKRICSHRRGLHHCQFSKGVPPRAPKAVNAKSKWVICELPSNQIFRWISVAHAAAAIDQAIVIQLIASSGSELGGKLLARQRLRLNCRSPTENLRISD